MKRCGDSQAFILLISAVFIVVAGISMTGCATTTALTKASYQGQTDLVKDVLDKGADPNKSGACAFGWGSVTPLSCAAYSGHMEAVKILLDRGANVDGRDPQNGWTALTCAVHKGHVEIAKLLIERGADIKYAMTRIKARDEAGVLGRLDGGIKSSYALLEELASKQQPSREQVWPPSVSPSLALPPTLPTSTALPLPTESAVPF